MNNLFKLTSRLHFMSKRAVDIKPQKNKYPGFLQTMYENANDHYFHHNNYLKSLLIYKARYEYGKLVKMDYPDNWEYSLNDNIVKLTRIVENEKIVVSFHMFDEKAEQIFINRNKAPFFYQSDKYTTLLFITQDIICIPYVTIEMSKNTGKLVLEVDYVSNDYPSTRIPNYAHELDSMPYVMFDINGEPLIEIVSISYYDENGNLVYKHDHQTIIKGFSECLIPYLEQRGINEDLFKSILTIAYRVDMDAYIQFLHKFVEYFPFIRSYEKIQKKDPE